MDNEVKITVKRLPAIASDPQPTTKSLWHGYRWWLDADETWRERFVRSRLAVVRRYGGMAGPHQQQYTSGTTGRRKSYRWGPNFTEVDRFFYGLVRLGGRLAPTANLHPFVIRDTGGANSIANVQDSSRYDIQRHVSVGVNGRGPIPGLADAIRGHNVFVSASAFSLLEEYAGVSACFDPNAMVIFTGEALPDETRAYLLDRGFDVRDQMRCWDGGATFVTCPHGNRHWIDFLAPTSTDGDGRLVSSDLFNLAQPHLDYRNGDVVVREFGETCPCGQVCCTNTFANRSANAAFKTPSGLVIAYETVFDAFYKNSGVERGQIVAACFGRFRDDADYRLRINYLTTVPVNEAAVRAAFFDHLGIRAELVVGVEPAAYKLRKIYYVED